MRRRSRVPVRISSTQKALRVPRKRIARLVEFVADREGVRVAEVDLAVVGPGEMGSLHRRWLGRSGPTDVLSFDLSEGAGRGLCAQLVVCGDVAAREAPLHGLTAQEELLLYVLHGLLHLMGYDDASARSAARLHAREDELLRRFLHPPQGCAP